MSDKKHIAVGDKVAVDLRASHGGGVDELFVIGEMKYSTEHGRVWLLATETAIGMPVGAHALTVVSSGHSADCRRWRDRYESRYPGCMKPLADTPSLT